MLPERESPTGFYDRRYAEMSDELTRSIREAAFGEDIGQFSWVTAGEHRRFQRALRIDASTTVLDVACGSGGPSLYLARTTGCRVVGVDIHQAGVDAASTSAIREGLGDRASFLVHDARQPFPFDDGTFDAIISIDSVNHVLDRAPMFDEWRRMVRPGGRVLYTDPVVVTGPILRDEVVARSGSMGDFVFTPIGTDEPLLRAAGFVDIRIEDATDTIATVSGNWHAARQRWSRELDAREGPEANAVFQAFLATVHLLATERRLSRLAYSAARR